MSHPAGRGKETKMNNCTVRCKDCKYYSPMMDLRISSGDCVNPIQLEIGSGIAEALLSLISEVKPDAKMPHIKKRINAVCVREDHTCSYGEREETE